MMKCKTWVIEVAFQSCSLNVELFFVRPTNNCLQQSMISLKHYLIVLVLCSLLTWFLIIYVNADILLIWACCQYMSRAVLYYVNGPVVKPEQIVISAYPKCHHHYRRSLLANHHAIAPAA